MGAIRLYWGDGIDITVVRTGEVGLTFLLRGEITSYEEVTPGYLTE